MGSLHVGVGTLANALCVDCVRMPFVQMCVSGWEVGQECAACGLVWMSCVRMFVCVCGWFGVDVFAPLVRGVCVFVVWMWVEGLALCVCVVAGCVQRCRVVVRWCAVCVDACVWRCCVDMLCGCVCAVVVCVCVCVCVCVFVSVCVEK